jgi:hypothetical protein
VSIPRRSKLDELLRLLSEPLTLAALHRLAQIAAREVRDSDHPLAPFVLYAIAEGLSRRIDGEPLDADKWTIVDAVLRPQLSALCEAVTANSGSQVADAADAAVRTYRLVG